MITLIADHTARVTWSGQ